MLLPSHAFSRAISDSSKLLPAVSYGGWWIGLRRARNRADEATKVPPWRIARMMRG